MIAALATIMFITAFIWMAWIVVVVIVLYWKVAGATTDPAPASS